MTTSIFLAKLMGPVMLAVGVALIVNAASFQAMAKQFIDNPALIYLAGIITLPTGIAIVLTHNVWTADWRVIITVFGWLAIFGGAVRLMVPQQAANVGRRMLARPMTLKISAAVWLLIGALLCFFGYLW